MKRSIAVFAALVFVTLMMPALINAQTRYEVDAAWPKPLPERWVTGGLGGLCIDKQDHVYILNRQDVVDGETNAGQLAPPIIEFDPAGNVVRGWGDLKEFDPRLHSCHVDKDNNIWIASAPSGMVQKYSREGKLLFQIGKKGELDSSDGTEKGKPLNSDAARFFTPSSIYVDPGNGDVYVADGETRGNNTRIVVMDKTGKFLRQWKPEGMQTVHCLAVSEDGEVYVCNRENARIQVYDKSGKFLRNIEIPWKPVTPGASATGFGGTAVALDFSPDAAQNTLYLINQNNVQIVLIDRKTGKILSSFGRPGRYPGQMDQPHGIAVDSKGNIYIAENRGKRVQKFVVKK